MKTAELIHTNPLDFTGSCVCTAVRVDDGRELLANVMYPDSDVTCDRPGRTLTLLTAELELVAFDQLDKTDCCTVVV